MNAIAKLIDTYSPITALQAKWLESNGYTGVARYLGYKNHKWDKAMQPSEVKILLDADLKIVSVWEGVAKAALNGYSQGVLDGAQAVDEALWLGQPIGTAIYFAVDFEVLQTNVATVQAYFNGVRKSIGSYKVGVYGGRTTMQIITADFEWQTAAWSYGTVEQADAMFQQDIDTEIDGMRVDIDLVYSNPGWWPVDVKPVTYPTYNVVVDDKVFEAIDVNGDTHILYTALDALSVPYSLIKDAQGQYHGVMQINGHNVQCVQYNGTTYVPYTVFPTKPIKVEWYFPKN